MSARVEALTASLADAGHVGDAAMYVAQALAGQQPNPHDPSASPVSLKGRELAAQLAALAPTVQADVAYEVLAQGCEQGAAELPRDEVTEAFTEAFARDDRDDRRRGIEVH